MRNPFRPVLQNFWLNIALLPAFAFIIWGCSKSSDVKPTPTSPPTITSLSRTLSTPGKELIITGTNFSSVVTDNTVTFNGTPSTVLEATPTMIKVIIPTATTGNIIVTVKGMSVTGPVFIVYYPGTVTDISPVCGPIGTTVTISGTGFEINPGDTYVLFASTGNLLVRAPVLTATTTQLTVAVPTGALSGDIIFLAFGSEDLLFNPPTTYFTLATFALAGFAPTSAHIGDSITIAGSGFDTTPANNTVTFPGVGSTRIAATITAATSTQLTVTVPDNTTGGLIDVKVGASDAVSFHDNFTNLF
jgi:hypothetical protein